MKAKFTRRKFLQTAAVTTTAAMIPGISGAAALTPPVNQDQRRKSFPSEGLAEATEWFPALDLVQVPGIATGWPMTSYCRNTSIMQLTLA